MAQLLDFGNGITGGGRYGDGCDCHIAAHSGLEYPELQVPLRENAILDGGSLGTTRANARRITVLLDFTSTWTRNQVAAAFGPGVTRTLTGTRGSIAYTVEAFSFPKASRVGRVTASVTMLCEWAYPRAATITLEDTGQLGWAAEAITDQQTTENADATQSSDGNSQTREFVGETVARTVGHRTTQFAFKTSQALGDAAYLGIFAVNGSDLPTGSPIATVHIGAVAANTEKAVALDWIAPATANYAFLVFGAAGDSTVSLRLNNAGGYASGQAVKGLWSAGGGFSAEAITGDDLYFKVYAQQPDTGDTEFVVEDSESEVLCYPLLQATILGTTASLEVTDGTHTLTITPAGGFAANDVVTVDSEVPSVTINGADAMADVVLGSEWPELNPTGTATTISTNPGVAASLSWAPRILGLI